MSDTEHENEVELDPTLVREDVDADADVDADDENSHQACYVFQPFPTDDHNHDHDHDRDDIEQQRPAKKRRKTTRDAHAKDEVSSASPFPLLNGGAEPLEFAKMRHDTFTEIWSRKHARITEIVERADETAWTEISRFVKETTMTMTTPSTTSPSSASRRRSGRLRTGLIVSGPDGGTQQSRLLKRWQGKRDGKGDGSERGESEEIFVQLGASHCQNLQNTLKNIIRSTISARVGSDGYQAFLNEHKRLIPMNFDLELLQVFVEHDGGLEKIVLSMMDVETFDMGVLSELLLMLSSWSDSIPFTVLLNLTTTIGLFESRLPKAVVEVLDATVFSLPSSNHVLQQILDDVVHDPEQKLVFGPLTVSALDEMRQFQGTSTELFTSAIQYIIMSHFFANSLSVLVGDSESIKPDKSLCDAIRNTKSFQRHCEAMLAQNKVKAKEVTRLLTDDEALIEASREAVRVGLSSRSGTSIEVEGNQFLNEAYFINSRQLLNRFNPRPRYALERALGQPGDYLSCDCCKSSATVSSNHGTPLPSATLYTLLQEAGTVINVRDLHDAFCARCFAVSVMDDQDDTATDKADRSRLSTFYSSLAELRMLGLVKSSTSAVIKKRALLASGLEASTMARGKDRYSDVDFVAKTGWAGL